MQIIQAPGTNYQNFVLTASGSSQVISAAANVRGIIVRNVTYNWLLTTVNANLDVVFAASTSQAYGLLDSNGAAGAINIPRGYSSDAQLQFPAGVALNIVLSSIVSVRLNVAVCLSIL